LLKKKGIMWFSGGDSRRLPCWQMQAESRGKKKKLDWGEVLDL